MYVLYIVLEVDDGSRCIKTDVRTFTSINRQWKIAGWSEVDHCELLFSRVISSQIVSETSANSNNHWFLMIDWNS